MTAPRPDERPAAADAATLARPHRTIRATRGFGRLDLGDLWRYRDLVFFLARRDIQLRYRQTFLGIAWALVQPLATMTVFTVVFGKLGKIPSDGLPYPLFALCGLLPWQLFSYALTGASNSLVANQNLVTKIHFPRLVIPVSAALSGLVDFGVALLLLLAMMAWFGAAPDAAVLVLPLLVGLTLLTALGAGLWFAALSVEYRDVRHMLPFLSQLWFFATPIAYPSSLVPARFHAVLGLNPMAGVVEGFRWALLGTGRAPDVLLVVSALITAVLLYTGLHYFQRVARTAADVL